MNKLLLKSGLLGLSLFIVQAYAGIQDGMEIPDEVIILNDTPRAVVFEGKTYNPGQSASFKTSGRAQTYFEVKDQQGRSLGGKAYPTYNRSGGDVQEIYTTLTYKVSELNPEHE